MSYQKKPQKKKPALNQCIINENSDSFIIAKRFNKFTSIVSPFVFNDDLDEYNSNFTIRHIRAYRVQSLYNLMPKISKYSVEQDYIHFDCLHKLPKDVFEGYKSGLMHFYMQNNSTNVENESGEQNEIINVDIKLLLKETENEEDLIFNNTSKINFTTDHIKVFPIMLSKGFVLAVATQETCTLFLTLLDPISGFVGRCARKEIANITQNIFPIWPFFNITADESTNKIFLKKDMVNVIRESVDHTCVSLKMEYDFSDPSKIYIQKTGVV